MTNKKQTIRRVSTAHSEPFKTGGIHRTWRALRNQVMAVIIFASYNYFCNTSFSWPLGHEIIMIFLIQVLFSRIQFKKVWGLALRGRGPWILIYLLEVYSHVTYYFWLSTFSNLSVRHNPYLIELIPLEFRVQIWRH